MYIYYRDPILVRLCLCFSLFLFCRSCVALAAASLCLVLVAYFINFKIRKEKPTWYIGIFRENKWNVLCWQWQFVCSWWFDATLPESNSAAEVLFYLVILFILIILQNLSHSVIGFGHNLSFFSNSGINGSL